MYQLTHFLSAELPRIDFKIDNYIFLQLQSSIFIRLYPSELIMCFDILLHQNNLFFYSFATASQFYSNERNAKK